MLGFRALVGTAVFALVTVQATKLTDEIYTTLTAEGVSRLLNEDGMIGSNSERTGNVGILYKIDSQAALTSFESAPDRDYIALVANSVLTVHPDDRKGQVVRRLQDSGKVKGVLLYDDLDGAGAGDYFSAANKIPNVDNGMLDGGAPPTHEWNKNGGGFCSSKGGNCAGDSYGMHWTDINMPFFLLNPEDTVTVLSKFNQSNNGGDQNAANYPLLGARVKFFQWAAPNSVVCGRRTDGGLLAFGQGFPFCQAIGGQNIAGFLRPFRQTGGEQEGVVMLSAAMDAVSMLHTRAFGADADALGLIALLAAAGVIGKVPDADRVDTAKYQRNIMVQFFAGEKWGYIGSSSFAQKVLNGNYPNQQNALDKDSIDYFIELDQLQQPNPATPSFFMHSDTEGSADKLAAVTAALGDAATGAFGTNNMQSPSAGGKQEMPPSSFRGVFAEAPSGLGDRRAQVGAVVIGGYDQQYNNNNLESRKDDGIGLGVNKTTGEVPQLLKDYVCKLATTVAHAALSLAAAEGYSPDEAGLATADCDYVEQLIHSITFNQTAGAGGVASPAASAAGNPAAHTPFNRYVDVFFKLDESKAEPGTFPGFLYNQLITQLAKGSATFPIAPGQAPECGDDIATCCQFTGGQEPDDPNAIGRNSGNLWNRIAVLPPVVNASIAYMCYTAPVIWTNDPSPAYAEDSSVKLRDDRDSVDPHHRFSTWAESTWDTEGLDIFLIGDPASDKGMLAGGIIYFFACVVGVWFARNKVEHVELVAAEAMAQANASN